MRLKNQSGFTLVELMVASAIGLLLLGAAFSFFLNNLQSSKNLMLYGKMQQELRQTADLMQREIRRAGFVGNGSSDVNVIYLDRQQSITATGKYDCILYNYNTAATTATKNSFGFLLDDKGTLWIKTAAGTNVTNNKTCPSAVSTTDISTGTWRALTSSPSTATASNGLVKITGFNISMNPPWSTGNIQMSAANSGNIITRPATGSGSGSNSFIIDGFKSGDLVTLSGFAAANNFVQAKITTVTATTIVLDLLSSTSLSTVLIDDANAANRKIDRQGTSLTIELSGQSPKDSKMKSTQKLNVNLFNIQALDAAI